MNSIIVWFLKRFQYVKNLLTALEHLKGVSERFKADARGLYADQQELKLEIEDLKAKLEDYEDDYSNYETEPPHRGPEHVPTPLRARRESNEQ
jgi:cell shape-determining protein MreC